MDTDLYNRLKELKRTRAHPRPAQRKNVASGPRARLTLPEGWREVREGVWSRTTYRSSAEAASLHTLLSDVYNVDTDSRSGRVHPMPAVVPAGTPPERLVFFDAETTGLSAGAGTTAFLLGFARLEEEGIRTRQLFLADYPDEPALLEEVAAELRPEDLLVSYNGKAFDSHVLQTRFVLNRMQAPVAGQLDLLYPTRRLWRRSLGQCGLTVVERGVLGITRGRDLPSAEVPERYFRFLRSADTSVLEDVFAHHLQDIESLAVLLVTMEEVFAQPHTAAEHREGRAAVDRYQLGRMLLAMGRSEALDLLRAAVEESRTAEESVRAARLLASHARHAGRFEEAAGVWRAVLARYPSVSAGIELAKHLEHRLRDPAEAEEVVLRMLSWPHSAPFRGELEHRLSRVRRKRSRRR